jgi:hypothetical protein
MMLAVASAEILFVDLDDLPLESSPPTVLINGPFTATIRFEPATAGGEIIATDSTYASQDGSSADRLSLQDTIGPSLLFSSPVDIGGFNAANDPVANDWFDPAGTPTRGYIGVASPPTTQGGDPHYAWIELTAEYNPATNEFGATLHSYAYENIAGRSIAAGAVPEPSSAVCMCACTFIAGMRRRRRTA